MKYSIIFSAVSLLSLPSIGYALPSKRDAASSAGVLIFALNLEYLENDFYRTALGKFSQEDFNKAGFAPWVRNRFEQIAEHEKTHVDFLVSALSAAGAPVPQPCEYGFPFTDVTSFVGLANVLETVGTSAYTGAAASITEGGYLTAAASILATEARHDAWIGSAALKSYPWSTPFEVALTPNEVLTLASPFIKSCPSGNPPLIAKPFPSLSVTVPHAAPGESATFSFQIPKDSKNNGKPLFAAFITGTGTQFVPLNDKREAKIPALIGTVFPIITNDGSKVTDETTVAGPAILMLPYGSESK